VPESDDEISRLAVTLNDMLVRLQAAFDHERRFVADASHELRTPLALLQTELDLALRRPRTHEELEKALRSAAEETQRLVRLAEDLLLIARADQAPLPIRREVVDADELMSDVATRFATRAEMLGREVRVETSGLRVDVDPLRVEQALANMLDNALVYGEGTVELRALEVGDHVELHAVDEGGGFPEQFGGSGLGLSIVELVASAHGGAVGVQNRPRGGADVWLSVPRAPSRAETLAGSRG
jgi:signal transduction histidine kinase